MGQRWVRRLGFWTAVGLTGGVVTPYVLEVLSSRFPNNAGLDRMLAIAHRGPARG